jgi:hypothetical protein
MEKILQKPHVIFEWKFSRTGHIYEVYAVFSNESHFLPGRIRKIIIGVTENIETNRIIPYEQNNSAFDALSRAGEIFSWGYAETVEEHLREDPIPVPEEVIEKVVKYLRQNA